MEHRLTCALAIAAISATSAMARTNDAALEKQLKAQYITYMNAIKARDIKPMEAMMAPDFKVKMGGHTMNRKQSLASMKQQLQAIKSVDKWNYRFGRMTRRGNMATGIVYEDTAMTVMGPDKKVHKMTEKDTTRASLRKMGGQWKLVTITMLNDHQTMDGKPYNPMAAMNTANKPMGNKMSGKMKGKM